MKISHCHKLFRARTHRPVRRLPARSSLKKKFLLPLALTTAALFAGCKTSDHHVDLCGMEIRTRDVTPVERYVPFDKIWVPGRKLL